MLSICHVATAVGRIALLMLGVMLSWPAMAWADAVTVPLTGGTSGFNQIFSSIIEFRATGPDVAMSGSDPFVFGVACKGRCPAGTIIDSWFTAGLRGTGSHDFEIAHARVGEDFSFPFTAFLSGPKERTTTGYPQPFFAIAPPIIAAVSLGIARDAIDSFHRLAQTKVPRRGTVTLFQQHTVQQRVGQAEARLRSARAYLYDTLRELDALRSRDAETLTEMVADCRLAGGQAAQSCVESVDSMFEAGGGSSIYETSRLERCFRDVHVVTHHHMVSPPNLEMVGQYLLGLGLQAGR